MVTTILAPLDQTEVAQINASFAGKDRMVQLAIAMYLQEPDIKRTSLKL